MDNEERLIELMIHYQAGQVEAFEELYGLIKPKLYQYLIVKCLDRSLAEDLLQETFLQIHRSRRTYLPGKAVTPWIFSIAHYVFLNDRRARVRRRYREESIENHLADFPIPPATESAVEVNGIKNAIAELSAEQREAMLLHHYWGLSFKEIGATLGIRPVTAKLRAHRGMLKLREYLNLHNVTEAREQANEPLDLRDP
jgi:RNA polymerase sigma-70 factor (ECF subfamily)